MRSLRNVIFLIIVSAITSSAGIAKLVEIGSGDKSAGLYIEWSDGYTGEFLVSFDETITGEELLDAVDIELGDNFVVSKQYYGGYGAAIDGIYYNDGAVEHFDTGYGGGEDWWHYWTRDASEEDWIFSFVGCSVRAVGDGDMDGWIYGRGGAPFPEPVSLMAAVLNIEKAIASKTQAIEAIEAALARERKAAKSLNTLLRSGGLGDLGAVDIYRAKFKLSLAMIRQSLAKHSLSRSVDKLEDVLSILTGEVELEGGGEGEDEEVDYGVELERADINGDGMIDGKDFAILSRHWLEEYENE